MNKKAEIRFSDEAEQIYAQLRKKAQASKADRMLLKAIERKIEIIQSNLFYGDIIPQKLIPDEYRKKYFVKNLLRVELPCFWRLLYTIKKGEQEIEIISFIIDILNHPEYSKKFGYKKR